PSPKPTTQVAQTHEEALMATMQQLANLLSGFQKQFPSTNNQLRASSNPRSQATWYVDKALLLNAQEKGEVLDAEAEACLTDVECTAPYEGQLAMTTTNMFQANHEDA
nr:hypothetical protein [Tanacetum cinerariifolium]